LFSNISELLDINDLVLSILYNIIAEQYSLKLDHFWDGGNDFNGSLDSAQYWSEVGTSSLMRQTVHLKA
jgi:hypothetical protein